MRRPLFLPAVGPEYEAWWRAMDARLARRATMGRATRRACLVSETRAINAATRRRAELAAKATNRQRRAA